METPRASAVVLLQNYAFFAVFFFNAINDKTFVWCSQHESFLYYLHGTISVVAKKKQPLSFALRFKPSDLPFLLGVCDVMYH